MSPNLSNEINALSVSERILLVEEIWDSIARENGAFELSASQKEALVRRSKSFDDKDPKNRSWEDIKAEFLKS
jgi:putative addiction module component (TIGR02574 family)